MENLFNFYWNSDAGAGMLIKRHLHRNVWFKFKNLRIDLRDSLDLIGALRIGMRAKIWELME